MTPAGKELIHECPKCNSIKTEKMNQGFRCLNCRTYFPPSRSGNEKKEVEVQG